MAYLSELHRQSAEHTTAYLGDYFKESTARADAVGSSYGRLWRHIDKVVMRGGKRIRPYLTMVGYGSYSSSVLPYAAAQELLHAALLIHDDIIDRDDIRHGRSNLNGLYKQEYAHIDEPHRTHYAHSAALLAGDLLIAGAHQLIHESEQPAADKITALSLLQQSIFEVAGGELMDVEATFMQNDELQALPIAIHKTASYSFIGPLLTGATLANAPKATADALRDFGYYLGIAFQIQDDLLGVFGQQERIGKSTLSDIHEGKRTLLIEQHLSSAHDADIFERVFGNPHASPHDVEAFKSSLESSGARAKSEKTVARYIKQASDALHAIPDNDVRKKELQHFSRWLMERDH